MKSRILTALVLIPPLAYVLGWGPKWLFVLVVIAAAEWCLYEFFAICRQAGYRPMAKLGYVLGVLLCLAPATPFWLGFLVFPFAATLVILSLALSATSDLKDYLAKVACTLLGVLYIPFALSWLVPLRYPERGSDPVKGQLWMLLIFGVIWGGDALAYFSGRAIGGMKLAPRISPNKTVAGAVGGLVGSIGVALIVWPAFMLAHPGLGLMRFILLVVVVEVAAQIGDLAESALKRGAGVKDSGSLLPGHGGMLDRLDSLLFAVPTLCVVLYLFLPAVQF